MRSEYYRTLSTIGRPERGHFSNTYATMLRDRRHKLVVYHGTGAGELFDLEADPEEFDNLWDRPEYASVQGALLLRLCDSMAFAVDYGPPQTARF